MALIIFDYDGVLADTLDDLLRFGQEACNKFGIKHNAKRDDLSSLEDMSFASYGRACEVPENLIDEFVQICLENFARRKSPPAIFHGLSQVVRRLAIKNTIVVVTTNSTQNVNTFLVGHGLDPCVQAVYGVDIPGSKSQKIARARNRYSADSRQGAVFMVGDSLSDIRAAKETSITSIAVTWGHQNLEHLLRGKPDYIVTSPLELVAVLEGIS